MVYINTNNGALMAAKASKLVQRNVDTASLRLSSGQRINSSADDAAGMAVSNKMVSQLRGMDAALKNTADGVSLVQTAIAGMQNSLDIAQRLRELAIQSHNGVYVDGDRNNLQQEADELLGELNRIATHTKFNDVNLLDGSYSKDMRVGNTNPEIVNVTIDGMGINKHIAGESYATGTARQILSPLEFAIGNSEFSLINSSYGEGDMTPRYLTTATASGFSSFNLPASSLATLTSTAPSYLSEANATGNSQYLTPAEANATGSTNPFYKTFTDAEVRVGSLSSTSTFTDVGFQNGDFTDGNATQNGDVVSIPGWDIFLRQPELDGDVFEIGGFQVPMDGSTPPNSNEAQSSDLLNNLSNINTNNLVRNGALYLEQGSYWHDSYAVSRGPYVVSQNAVSLEVGDTVSFEWFGLNGGDAYDVYGYLLNEDTGSTIQLLNETGTTSQRSTQDLGLGVDGWISAGSGVSTAGNYKFVFIAGSYDRTGGQLLGNGLAIRNIDVVQANPPSLNEFKATVTAQAVESQQVRINANLLSSAENSKSIDPGGTYSILAKGSDYGKFTIDPNTGNISSNQQLFYDVQNRYQFEIQYNGPNGTVHNETVNLNLTPHDEAFSTLTSDEADSVRIDPTQLTSFKKFMDFEANRNFGQVVTYGLRAYSDNDGNPANNGDPDDYLQFSIDQNTGVITSNVPLDYSDETEFHFDVTARAADGRTFVNHVVLNLQDTFNSSSVLAVEETDQIKINLSELTSSSDFSARYAGGAFSIAPTGLDNNLFSIVGNEIIANGNFRIPNKSTYQFDLVYTNGGTQHTERVTVNLTEFLQSDTAVTALEANRVNISLDDLTHITNFAVADGYGGSFRLERYDNADGNSANDGDADDVNEFTVDQATRMISSFNALDYSVEDTFHFNVVYRASDGREFTDRVVLSLEDTLASSAVLEVEEADQMVINIGDLTASNTYASRNPGGSYSIGTGSNLFRVVGNQVIADKEFRKEEQLSYNFELIYTHGTTQHVEDVTVNLTRFMQSEGTFTALEASTVFLNGNEFTYLDDYARDNPGGMYQLSGADAGLFGVNNTGAIYSLNALDYDSQQSYRLNLDYVLGSDTFSSEITLNLEDTLTAQATLSVEEAQSVIVQGNLLTSLQAYAAKDGNQGIFELLEQGDHDKFTMASDGTLTSKGELRMADDPVLDLYIRYNSASIDNFVEHVQINLTPTSYDHSRSEFVATESSEVIIVPQINTFLAAYAEADNYAGSFELAQSPYTTVRDHLQFEIDNTGQISSTGRIDFESGRTEFEVTVYYNHSSGTKRYTDFRRLDITNDKRDDNNLALEGIDISTREGAADAAELLNEVIVGISAAQAKLGAIENRFTHNIDNLSMNILMSEQANGRIVDADYAAESTRLARSQILEQAATNMLVNANQAKQNLLMLIN